MILIEAFAEDAIGKISFARQPLPRMQVPEQMPRHQLENQEATSR
ncbi:hypothetical protein [Bradyrhizobium stylosanthis]|nr:hypothetical protein [Bradyrhizobium stylosanthis]